MKRLVIITIGILMLGSTSIISAQKKQNTVPKWGIFTIELKGPSSGNPFTDIELSAVFRKDLKEVKVNGFYDGDGRYLIHFSPGEEGIWIYQTKSNSAILSGKTGKIKCIKPEERNHGPVKVVNTYYLEYEDGTPYFSVGTTCYAWIHQPEDLQQLTLKTLASSPFNKLRMCIFPKSYAYNANEPDRFPFIREKDSTFNFSRFDPVFWRHLEKQIVELGKLGIQADLILFHGYDRWGFSEMDDSSDDRYIRYAISRLAAYNNVWWSLANEFDFMLTPPRQNHRGNKQLDDWDRFFLILQQEDPYQRMRSIHNGHLWYDHTKTWVTHASIQSSDLAKGIEFRNKYKKPIIFDECRYEGNITQGWGRLSGKEMVQRFWIGVTSGCYVGHGETFMHPQDIIWWSKGGELHGESPQRIAYLRRIMEEVPFKELVPVQLSNNIFILEKPEQIYLVYVNEPGQVEIKLEGQKSYNVDVIDTWNMTTKSLAPAKPGIFNYNTSEGGILIRFTVIR
jgi:hypothetical protein